MSHEVIWKRINKTGLYVFSLCLLFVSVSVGGWINIVFKESAAAQVLTSTEMVQADDGTNCSEDGGCAGTETDTTKREEGVTIPVLMFHHIRQIMPWHTARERYYTITPARFKEQMVLLKEGGYTPITLAEFRDALEKGSEGLPDKPVLLTFDDGYRGHYENALPVLKELGFPAVFFIYTEARTLHGFMNEDMIREIADDPSMDIGSHSESHTALTRLGAAHRKAELDGSKQILEEITGQPVYAFSYPYGSKTKAMEQELENAGYALGFRIGPGVHESYDQRFSIPRIQVMSWDNPETLIQRYGGK